MANKTTFFSDEVHEHFHKTDRGSLEGIISEFPIKLKRAMYAATEFGRIGANRWEARGASVGCAFHRAGEVEGEYIVDTAAAAKVFDTPQRLVSRFITKWDTIKASDTSRARILKDALLAVGIETPPWDGEGEHNVVIASIAFKGAETKFLEQLEAVDSVADLVHLGFTEDDFDVANELVGAL